MSDPVGVPPELIRQRAAAAMLAELNSTRADEGLEVAVAVAAGFTEALTAWCAAVTGEVSLQQG